ncbi:MAG TPA: PAS domain-containing sensor histidine kinase [Cyanobacteria bacterium UBA11367]|nr:PAS domain-containing sensor histidine kinase [Cyanobacteria bacterium UBA11367]HBK65739.1 PAS domain-containing sensor histidine kinase [Cyanobacteria bacterium UBA11166]HCA95812.1 PAS domain-containing sensor histidine kinase [Cyanobacteria bacterium UBA9226]
MQIKSLDTLIENAQQRIKFLEDQSRKEGKSGIDRREKIKTLLKEALIELSISLEELQVCAEELNQQNAELLSTQQILDSERHRYQDLFNFAPDGYIVTTVTGIIREANIAAAQFLHVRQSYLIGKPLSVFIHPEDRKEFRQISHQLLHKDQIRDKIFRMIYNLRNSEFPAELTAAAIRDLTGNLVKIRWLFRNIRDRQQFEKKIREQAALLDITSDAIFVRRLDRTISFWNRGAVNLYGWTVAEALGKKANELLGDNSSEMEKIINITLIEGKWHGELHQRTKIGKEVIVEAKWTLVRSQTGLPQAILIVHTDITDKKLLEKQFLRAQRLESIGTMASGIAHDLNNVFTPIIGLSQLLKIKFPHLNRSNQEYLNIMESNAKRGAALIKQVLSFAKGISGKHQPVQIKHLIGEVAQVIRSTFPKNIAIEVDIPEDLWQISGDITQLHQVLMNLCINARDAMIQGGILHISCQNLSLDRANNWIAGNLVTGAYVKIAIADTGTGIPPKIIDRIFDPFFTTKEQGKGTGLGLSTVIGILKSHRGFIDVLTEVDKGSEFQVFLPADEITIKQSIENLQLPSGNGELILIVDDEELILRTTSVILETYNYRVLTANDGIEAIYLYRQHYQEIHLVLLDMMMPTMTGETIIQMLQNLNSKVKILAMSGLETMDKLAIDLGANGFLVKPYAAEDLLIKLSELIN